MQQTLAVGVSSWARGDGGWDLTPLIAAIAILMLARMILRARMRAATIAAAVAFGAIFAGLSDRLGLLVPSALALLALLVADRLRPRPRES